MNEPFGPFVEGIDPVERVAQLRVLRTLVHGHLSMIEEGWYLEVQLRGAERCAEARAEALRCLDALPALVRRRILATFAYVHKPLYSSARKQPKKGTANALIR